MGGFPKMDLAEINNGMRRIMGLNRQRSRVAETLTPLEQLILFGEVSNEIVDVKMREAEKTCQK